jgi:hypothetical protein
LLSYIENNTSAAATEALVYNDDLAAAGSKSTSFKKNTGFDLGGNYKA